MNEARRSKIEKWWWVANLPFCAALYVWAYGTKFDPPGVLILYLALVSVHALVKTCATEELAAEAKDAA